MTAVPIVSWNVRGLHNPLKRSMFFSLMRKYLSAICVLQEINLTTDTLSCLGYSWVGWAFHSTHTSYSSWVSVLVHLTLDFQVYDKQVDTEGHYVILLYMPYFQVKCIVAFVYIPPPFNSAVLRVILTYQQGSPGIPLYLVGDLNC